MVEIVGSGRGWAEMVEKAGEYLRMGADRVWVVDPNTAHVHVFRGDAAPIVIAGDETLNDAAILPGFSLKLVDLFGE